MTEEFHFRDLQQAWGVGRTFEVSLNDLYPEREFESASEFSALLSMRKATDVPDEFPQG